MGTHSPDPPSQGTNFSNWKTRTIFKYCGTPTTNMVELRLSHFVIMIVFDSSTLILVTKLELLDLFLAAVKQEVIIPKEVERECCGVKKTLDALVIQKALDESRIKARAVKNMKLVAQLQATFSLGKGEAEAISLALQEKAHLLGVDDQSGINACKLMGIPFTTAIAILVRSREKGFIDRDSALEKLGTLAMIGRYKRSIIEDAKLKLEAGL
jgi:predicted nucleic acid-binding protein